MRRFALFALCAFGLAACDPELPPDGTPPEPVGSANWLVTFDTCDDLKTRVTDSWLEQLVQGRYGYGWGWLEDDVDASPNTGSDAPTDYSETNVQEEGVDEPDLVKTDGTHIYVVESGHLFVVDSWPVEEANIVADLAFDDINPFSMFLYGDRLALFSYDYGAFEQTDEDWRYGYGTRITLIDVTDRANPSIEREVSVEGWFADARLINDDMYVVVNAYMGMPYALWDELWNEELNLPEMDWEASPEDQEAARDEAREILRPIVTAAVAAIDIDALLPRKNDSLSAGVEPLVACEDVYRPNELGRTSILSVVHLDLDDANSDLSTTSLMAEGWTVYASQDSLYVSQSSWWWWWGWGDLDLDTHIHKFELSAGEPQYVASGSVPGWTLDQFAFSEHDGYLRVATTDIDWWWGTGEAEGEEPANNVFVLEQRSGDLVTVGEVRGIAPNERIMSSRMQGDRGYLVTFEFIDPLFTLDLSNPYAPVVVGELEVPGFSSYIHPLGEDHLLTVGMDGTADGQLTGMAISIFDISDYANPTLAHRLTIESDDWSWSEALWNHHAFTFHRDVLSMPLYTWSGGNGFSGMLVVDVDAEDGLTELGRVSHEDLVATSTCLYEDTDEPCASDYYWYAWMRRSVVIEDNLFSLSTYGMKVNELEAPENEITSLRYWPVP